MLILKQTKIKVIELKELIWACAFTAILGGAVGMLYGSMNQEIEIRKACERSKQHELVVIDHQIFTCNVHVLL